MTGGSIAVLAAWTATGHQAMRNVVEIVEEVSYDIVTAFHPEVETQRTLLYGSNWVEIPASTAGSSLGSTQTFTFSNDVDAIGDMWARVKIDLTMTTEGTAKKELPALSLPRILDRLEIMVGNSTWQTMHNADIIAMAATTLSNGAYDVFDSHGRGLLREGKALPSADAVEEFGAGSISCICWVPLPTFTQGGPARAHLVSAAPHQSVRAKFTYAYKESLGPDVSIAENLDVVLFCRQHVMSNAEREQVRGSTIAKTVHLTQHQELNTNGNTSGEVIVELDSASLLTSHLLVCSESADDSAGTSTACLKSAELLLNTSSHSGVFDANWLSFAAAESMGLQTNIKDPIVVGGIRRDFWVIPIASTPYGSDGCPLNRFDTIRLKLTWLTVGQKVHVTVVGTSTALYKNSAASMVYLG